MSRPIRAAPISGRNDLIHQIHIIDSHTGGEPTRVIVDGGPDLGTGTMSERRERFQTEYDRYRSAVVNEPRGSDPVVGALLCEPLLSDHLAGVIFFNNVGYLGMCGHGMIGLVATLAYLGRVTPGLYHIETPVGTVTAELHKTGEVSLTNVASYRYRKDVVVDVPDIGPVRGDVAWGGNWFFLVAGHGQELALKRVDRLIDYTGRIMTALADQGITGKDGAGIDHVELFGPPVRSDADSRNFVLCPGGAYDRSPCGTGTSAKLACLYEDGELKEGETWRQESIVGSVFEGRIQKVDGHVYPVIRGSAFVNSEATLILDDRDPFCWGIRS